MSMSHQIENMTLALEAVLAAQKACADAGIPVDKSAFWVITEVVKTAVQNARPIKIGDPIIISGRVGGLQYIVSVDGEYICTTGVLSAEYRYHYATGRFVDSSVDSRIDASDLTRIHRDFPQE